jgi:hypothetical protein
MKDQEIPRQKEQGVAAKRLQMVEQFRRSGLSRRAFCESEGIARSTLDWWLRKAKRIGQEATRVEFSEVRMAPAITGNWGLELVSPHGWTLRRHETLGAADMARLLKRLKC